MDFVILKVNGQDVSNSSHEDAVRCFQSAQEPIVVEVLRRQPIHGQRTPWKEPEKNEERTIESYKREQRPVSVCPTLVSTAVQTDWAGLIEEAEEEVSLDTNEHFLSHDIDFEEVTLRKTASAEKLGLTVCYSSGSGSEDADTEVYISEIVPESVAARDGRLREGDQILRVNGKDVANKEQTENLFAETKNAVTILVSRCLYQDDEYEDRRDYRRGSPTFSPDHLPSYQNSLIEQLIRQQQQQTEERTKETEQDGPASKPAPPPVPSHTGSTTIVTVAASAATVATAATSSSSTCSSLNSQKSGRNAASPARQTDHDRKQRVPEALNDCSKKMEGLCLRSDQLSSNSNCGGSGSVKLVDAYSNHAWNETEHIYETIPESDSEPIYSSPYEHRNWQRSNHCAALTATAIAATTVAATTAIANASLPITTASTTILPHIGKWHCSSKSNSSGEEKDSSSAYNTGESCNSNPLTLELQRGERDHHKSTLVLCPPKTPSAQQHQQRLACTCLASANKQTKSQSTRRGSGSHHFRDKVGADSTATTTTTTTNTTTSTATTTITAATAAASVNATATATTLVVATTAVTATATLPADTMYTNMANLQQTMLLQQQLFKRALDRRNSTVATLRDNGGAAKKSRSHGNFQAPNLARYQFIGSQQVCASSPWIPPEGKGNDVQMEWKVKRRADGTRYIARRPVRNRILRNRAIKISEERAGHSTEDDTMSEAKIGRYWTKEERKRQLERARERKQRQQELMLQHHQQQQQQLQQLQSQQTNQLLICEHGDEKTAKKPINILELSHKKMARKKNALDDFTTVQEMLVHGNRVGGTTGSGTGGKLMGLLSVTTV